MDDMKKRMTIEELARISQQEFLGIQDRFTGIDQRFDGIDQRLDKMDGRFDSMMNMMDAGFKTIQMNFETLNGKVDNWGIVTQNLDQRLTRVEKHLSLKPII